MESRYRCKRRLQWGGTDEQQFLPKLGPTAYTLVRTQLHGYIIHESCLIGTPVSLMRALLDINNFEEVGEEWYLKMTFYKGPVMKYSIPCFWGCEEQ